MSISPHASSATVQPVLLSISEAAQLLGIGRSTLYGLLSDGDLSGLKIGARTLIRRTDLEALLERLPRK
ncbi:helix-turn-helix domain-containing protein [Bradyrhizobium sp. UFLA05-112]